MRFGVSHVKFVNIVLYLPSAPDDYLEQSGTVDLTSSSTKQCISIPIEDDSIDESDQECFVLSLSSDSTDVTVSPATATICIEDNDGKLFHISSYHASIERMHDEWLNKK